MGWWLDGCMMCDFTLINWWWGSRVVFQESCAGKLLSSVSPPWLLGWPKSLFGFPIISYGKTRINFFNNPIATVRICPLELREDLGGWNIFPSNMNWISSNEVDETGAYYTEWSKPERKTPIQYTNAYIWNLERW